MLLPLRQALPPIVAVAIPALSRVANDDVRFRRAAISIVNAVALGTMPLAVILIVQARAIVTVLLGPKWTDAAPLVAILGFYALVQPLLNVVVVILQSRGHARQFFIWGIGRTIVVVSAMLFGLRWGPMGVAAALVTVSVFGETTSLFWLTSRLSPVRQSDMYWATVPYMLLAGAAGGVWLAAGRLVGLHLQAIYELVAGSGCIGTVYVVLLMLLPRGRQGLENIRSMVQELVSGGRAAGAAS
jgi:PST family polysaccharide transporter